MSTIYVRKFGSDANDGSTVALAKLTMTSAYTVASIGDTINLGVGVWEENMTRDKDMTWEGQGMFLTTIKGISGNYQTGHDLTMKNLKFLVDEEISYTYSPLTFGDAVLTAIFENVWIDFLYPCTTNSMMYLGDNTTFTADNFILSNMSTGNNYIISLGGDDTVITLNNCIFYNIFGGQYSFRSSENSTTTATNCIFHTLDGYLKQDTSSFTRVNCCIYNWPSDGSCTDGGGNLDDTDPLFVDVVGGDFRLRKDSPCIGAGA